MMEADCSHLLRLRQNGSNRTLNPSPDINKLTLFSFQDFHIVCFSFSFLHYSDSLNVRYTKDPIKVVIRVAFSAARFLLEKDDFHGHVYTH